MGVGGVYIDLRKLFVDIEIWSLRGTRVMCFVLCDLRCVAFVICFGIWDVIYRTSVVYASS